MKKLIKAIGVIAGFSISVNAQSPKNEIKEHKCSSTCSKDQHDLKHGENGHVCIESCKPKM